MGNELLAEDCELLVMFGKLSVIFWKTENDRLLRPDETGQDCLSNSIVSVLNQASQFR